MTDLFAAADQIIVGVEKTHSSDQEGGDTWWGVARRFHVAETPWPPTFERAQQIRRSEYWDKYQCGAFPWSFALGLYDGVINQGGSVVRMLQGAIGVPQDGAIGPRTLAAAQHATPELFQVFMAYRARSYVQDSGYEQNGLGWFKRLFQIAQCAVIIPAYSIPSGGPS